MFRFPRKAVIAVSALGLVALTACGGSSGSSGGGADGPVEITFSYLWAGPEGEAVEQIITDFNESQDEIVVRGVSSPDTQQQLTAMSSANGTFDISDNFGTNLGAWASRGILEPLDEHLAANDVSLDDFVPATMEQMYYEDTVYAMPITVHTFQLMYNQTLLDEAGIPVPTTMDELAAAVRALTVQEEDGTVTRVGLSAPALENTITTLGYAFGGNWDEGNQPTPTVAGNVEGLNWWYENVIEPVGADNYATFVAGQGEYNSAADPFYSGTAAMVIDGEWRALSAPVVAPELDWGVTSIPVSSAGLEGVTQVTTSTLFIPANSQHKEEAATFLAYLVGEQGMTDFALALGNLPSRVDLIDSDAFSDIENFDVWLSALGGENVFTRSSAPYQAEYTTDLTTAFDEVTRGGSSAADALAGVAERAQSYSGE